jgi:hypothetical protein
MLYSNNVPSQELDTLQDIPEDVILPPSDLYSDEPPLETELHLRQIILLLNAWNGCGKTGLIFTLLAILLFITASANANQKTSGDQIFSLCWTPNAKLVKVG